MGMASDGDGEKRYPDDRYRVREGTEVEDEGCRFPLPPTKTSSSSFSTNPSFPHAHPQIRCSEVTMPTMLVYGY